MKIEKDYKNRSWKISSKYLDEPIYVSLCVDIVERLPSIEKEIRKNKIEKLLKMK